jgi:hypothetical protein
MTNTINRESATIYQFPVGGRAGLVRKHDDSKATGYLASQGMVDVASGSGWYHEEAMQAERTRKN